MVLVRHSGHGMETTFYEEQYPVNAPVEHIKRSLTLDLDVVGRQYGKRARAAAPVLSSPDLHMLKLGSPELEKLIIQNGMVTTATPTPGAPVLFPAAAEPTEEQEMYARGFVEALNELHTNETGAGIARGGGGGGGGGGAMYTDLDRLERAERYPSPLVKDEPQTVPSASSSPRAMSPIDMESQEKIKLERKRQRNRVAASKCRRRKLERISRLEDKVKLLKGENSELATMVLKLKEHVYRLKEQVMEHVHSGCQIDGQF